MSGVVERLHGLLVEAVRERRQKDPYDVPVTVAEIYQDLVPYRNVRSALGLDMNADYEHTLLRLLSGEGGLARLEPATAREQIARELESPNPNVGLYRKFAGCDVRLEKGVALHAPEWVEETLAEETEAEPMVEPDAVEDGWRALSGLEEDVEESSLFDAAEADPAPVAAAPEAPAAPVRTAGHCAFCDSTLPQARSVRYCPYCGADQAQHPCSACGEAVEAGWSFCVACGAPQGA